MIRNKEDIYRSIYNDKWMMDVLRDARSLNLPDWWICAGFVRSKIWDVLHEFEQRTVTQDVDVIYFDKKNIDKAEEKRFEEILYKISPQIPWSVKNEARMHLRNNMAPYISAEDAIAKFPETVTAIGVKMDRNDHLILTAPHGTSDIINMVVRPTPYFFLNNDRMKTYYKRMEEKQWTSKWKMVTYS